MDTHTAYDIAYIVILILCGLLLSKQIKTSPGLLTSVNNTYLPCEKGFGPQLISHHVYDRMVKKGVIFGAQRTMT